jgi:hypothetical protein
MINGGQITAGIENDFFRKQRNKYIWRALHAARGKWKKSGI